MALVANERSNPMPFIVAVFFLAAVPAVDFVSHPDWRTAERARFTVPSLSGFVLA
jgi:hypothetical protein